MCNIYFARCPAGPARSAAAPRIVGDCSGLSRVELEGPAAVGDQWPQFLKFFRGEILLRAGGIWSKGAFKILWPLPLSAVRPGTPLYIHEQIIIYISFLRAGFLGGESTHSKEGPPLYNLYTLYTM